VNYTERIAIDGTDVDEYAWVRSFEDVWPLVEKLSSNSIPDYAYGRPSLIEVLFAMACVHFRESGVTWAAIEAGLGGRLDPTNTLAPDAAVITNVSLEHTQILGSTVAAIAAEKAAIIKPGSEAVTAAADPEALEVIASRSDKVASPLTVVGSDVNVAVLESCLEGQRIRLGDTCASVEVRLPLAGRFQVVNAATAFAVARALQRRQVPIVDADIVRGLERVHAPGRLEIRSMHPIVILDGAHNPAAAKQLSSSLQELLPGKTVHLVVAAMADKDIDGMATELSGTVTRVYATLVPGTDRAAQPEALAESFRSHGVPAEVVSDPEHALARASDNAGVDDVVLVAGSMYLVGWLRRSGVVGRV
jgi:dihydrofolate synthase/folylpolyglutamate synthase